MSSSAAQSSGGLLTRWARFATSKPKQVLLGWLIGLIVLAGITVTLGGTFVDSFSVPGTESQQAVDLLSERFPSQAGDSATLVFEAPTGINDPAVQQHIGEILAESAALPEVLSVTSPYDVTSQISADGTIAYATVQYDKPGSEIDIAAIEELTALVDRSSNESLTVEVGGQAISASERPETGTSELIGIAVAIIILLFTFGSVVAMGMPIISALVGVMMGFMGATIAAAFLDLSTISTAFVSMIGLGVGIDYALFIVTRYREARATGVSTQNAVVTAVDTAGRAVIFAGTIVIIALLGLFIVGIPFVGWMGAAGALVVFTSVLVAVGLLPSLLTWVGPRIDKWSIPTPKPKSVEDTLGYKMTTTIQKRPVLWLVGGLAIVLAIASPVLDARVGTADAGNNPESMHSRRSYDLLAKGFGPGFNGPLLIVVNNDAGLTPDVTGALQTAFTGTDNVVAVTQPFLNEAGDTAILTVIPGTSPQDVGTEDLISNLRDNVIPSTLDGTDTQAFVGGGTATFVDISQKIASGLPIYIAIVAGLSILVLMTVFRSVVIPIKAADPEPDLLRRRLRCAGCGFPEGLGCQPDWHRPDWSDRIVPAANPVRHSLRPLDGLRSLPGQPDPRILAGEQGQQLGPLARYWTDRSGDHRRRGDHDRRLPLLRAR